MGRKASASATLERACDAARRPGETRSREGYQCWWCDEADVTVLALSARDNGTAGGGLHRYPDLQDGGGRGGISFTRVDRGGRGAASGAFLTPSLPLCRYLSYIARGCTVLLGPHQADISAPARRAIQPQWPDTRAPPLLSLHNVCPASARAIFEHRLGRMGVQGEKVLEIRYPGQPDQLQAECRSGDRTAHVSALQGLWTGCGALLDRGGREEMDASGGLLDCPA